MLGSDCLGLGIIKGVSRTKHCRNTVGFPCIFAMMPSDIAGISTVHNLEMEETTDKLENFSQLN